MVNLTALRNKIEAKVFDNLGSTFLRSAYTQGSNDKWGDNPSESYAAPGTSIVAVPWLHIKNRNTYQPFGDLQEGDVDMAFKYNQTLVVNDMLYSSVLSQSYLIKEIEEFPLADGLLVKVARLHKKLV